MHHTELISILIHWIERITNQQEINRYNSDKIINTAAIIKINRRFKSYIAHLSNKSHDFDQIKALNIKTSYQVTNVHMQTFDGDNKLAFVQKVSILHLSAILCLLLINKFELSDFESKIATAITPEKLQSKRRRKSNVACEFMHEFRYLDQKAVNITCCVN